MQLRYIKYGLLGAAISLIIAVLLYLSFVAFSPFWWIKGLVNMLLFAFYIVLAVLAAKKLRQDQRGLLTFTEGFGMSMIIFLLIVMTNIGFNLVLYTIVDKDYADKLKIATIERLEKQFGQASIDDELTDNFMGLLRLRSFDYKGKEAINTLTLSVIVYSIVSLIIALSLKKKIDDNSKAEEI